MNYGSDPADQIVRISLEGTEMVLKLSGLAAKNFALFVYAVLNDQQKVRGKTKLVRMLKERRPFKFFTVPENRMKEFARETAESSVSPTAPTMTVSIILTPVVINPCSAMGNAIPVTFR